MTDYFNNTLFIENLLFKFMIYDPDESLSIYTSLFVVQVKNKNKVVLKARIYEFNDVYIFGFRLYSERLDTFYLKYLIKITFLTQTIDSSNLLSNTLC